MLASKLLIEHDDFFRFCLYINVCLYHFNVFLQFFITGLGELVHYHSFSKWSKQGRIVVAVNFFIDFLSNKHLWWETIMAIVEDCMRKQNQKWCNRSTEPHLGCRSRKIPRDFFCSDTVINSNNWSYNWSNTVNVRLKKAEGAVWGIILCQAVRGPRCFWLHPLRCCDSRLTWKMKD